MQYQEPPAVYSVPAASYAPVSDGSTVQRSFESTSDIYRDLEEFASAAHAQIDEEED